MSKGVGLKECMKITGLYLLIFVSTLKLSGLIGKVFFSIGILEPLIRACAYNTENALRGLFNVQAI